MATSRCSPLMVLDGFVDALATRISAFDKWAIANTKRLVNASLPADVEIGRMGPMHGVYCTAVDTGTAASLHGA